MLPRVCAGLISAAVIAALGPPVIGSTLTTGSLLLGLWIPLKFFTIITNLLAGIGFGLIAWRGRDALGPVAIGALVLALALVGLVANFLLPPLPFQNLAFMLGDRVHHVAAPIAAAVWWLAFARHGMLVWRDAFIWALFPLAYSAYALIRAGFEPATMPVRYPYFFMDPGLFGWEGVVRNLGAIALAFVIFGLAVIALDKALGRRAPKTTG